MIIHSQTLRRLATSSGFQLCGIARARPLTEHLARFTGWLGKGNYHGLTYLSRDPASRLDPSTLITNAASVVVCAVNYKNKAFEAPCGPIHAKVSSYALIKDYHITVKGMLAEMLEEAQKIYPGLRGRIYCDSGTISEKSWAAEAGLGWIGRNSLLITPQFGSTVFLGILVLDRQADQYDKPMDTVGCERCHRCRNACPTGAIKDGGEIDTRICVSRLTTQKCDPGMKSVQKLHGWVFGCDECQRCCPYNLKSPFATDPRFALIATPEQVSVDFGGGIDQQGFDEKYGSTPMGWMGRERIMENIARVRTCGQGEDA